jgi:MFS family permease
LNRWPDCPLIPPGPRAALSALHLDDPRPEALARLSDEDWRAALTYTDRARLTLILRDVARDAMLAWVRDRVDSDAAKFVLKTERFDRLYRELHALLPEFIALKGRTHDALPGRIQYDVDLYLPGDTVYDAQKAMIANGWHSVDEMESFPTDHLPVLMPPSDWKWTGDFFDPEMTIPVELHFRFWNDETERLRAPGVEEFWNRRTTRRIAGVDLNVLSPPDVVAFASLHLLKHVFRGSVNALHIYEIARMLPGFEWDERHPARLRELQAIAFRLAREWFGGPAVGSELLSPAAEAWFEQFPLSPATQRFVPNKDHLWLQLPLLDTRADAWRVARRRLLPGNLPPRAGIVHTGKKGYLIYTLERLRHHALSVPRTAASGLRFWWSVNALGPQFWRFLIAAALFNFGLFIFFLHYNLFLLDLGFREDFVGTVNSATRIGSMAGTIPAALVAQRFGLRKALLGTILATASAECLRAMLGARMPLAGLAFLSGCTFSVWAVILAPIIAGAVGEKRRATAFSVFFACMFTTGIVGNWIAGRAIAWFPNRRSLLLTGAAISALAVLPALRLRGLPRAPAGARVYPRSRFLALYLVPFALWHLATGVFNPFNNVYFKRLGFADQRIGSTFALSQVVQVVALLCAPLVIRRFGLLTGIVLMMGATAAGLAALASGPTAGAATAAYFAYMSFQWMSEPGLNTLVMNHVDEKQRSGASALIYVVAFGAQAVAAAAGGAIFTRFGYGPGLTGAALLALAAAVLFQALLSSRRDSAPA